METRAEKMTIHTHPDEIRAVAAKLNSTTLAGYKVGDTDIHALDGRLYSVWHPGCGNFPVECGVEDLSGMTLTQLGEMILRVGEACNYQHPPYLDHLRTTPEIVQTPTGRAMVTPHTVNAQAKMLLAMGVFHPCHHLEFSFTQFAAKHGGMLRIHQTRVTNNHTRDDSISRPYVESNYPVEYLPLFAELIEEARANPYTHPGWRIDQ